MTQALCKQLTHAALSAPQGQPPKQHFSTYAEANSLRKALNKHRQRDRDLNPSGTSPLDRLRFSIKQTAASEWTLSIIRINPQHRISFFDRIETERF